MRVVITENENCTLYVDKTILLPIVAICCTETSPVPDENVVVLLNRREIEETITALQKVLEVWEGP